MVLRPASRLLGVLLWAVVGLLVTAPPATAHENHQRAQAEERAALGERATRGAPADHKGVGSTPAPSMPERLLSWAGRMHPFAVHFPIALIPASWIALVIARRRGGPTGLIRALVIFAGAAAFLAALFGWLNAGFPFEDRPLLAAHRWAGTVLGLAGAALSIWAWRSADLARSRAMTWALGLVTLFLLVQGWVGAAITHGLRHMMI